MKKRLYVFLAAVLLCAAILAGCSCSPAGSAASSTPAASVGSTADAANSTGTNATSQPAAESASEPEHSFTGIIDSAGMGVYYVLLDDGTVIEVPQDGLEDSGLTDTMPGVTVTVRYTGTLNGNDTSGITFISIANA